MANLSKRFVSLFLTIITLTCLLLSAVPSFATSDHDDILFSDLVSKTAERIDEITNKYEIALSVPGKDSKGYNEIILMIDASKSMFSNITNYVDSIQQIGESILNSNKKIRFSLMHFGIAGGTIFSVDSKEELQKEIDGLTVEILKRWPTATNCEAGFVHIQEHIVNSPNLNKALVIYATDGEANENEIPLNFYEHRLTLDWAYSKKTLATHFDLVFSFFDEIQSISDLTLEMFPEVFKDLPDDYDIKDISGSSTITSSLKEKMKANEYEKFIEWVERLWEEAYESAGLEPTKAYPISTVEKAIINAHGMESFAHFAAAIAILDAPFGGDASCESIAQEAGASLASMPQVEELLFIALHEKAWINNLGNNYENVVVERGTTSNYIDKIIEYGNNISHMPINDPIITDPMSKWVNLDENSIRIYKDNIEIWNKTDGWLITEDRPLNNGEPIEIILDATTGKHTIKWKVKDGPLFLMDNLMMKYNVTVDTEADGFSYNTTYPANKTTYIDYTDDNGALKREGVIVPEVHTPGTNTDDSDDIKLVLHKYSNTDTDIKGDGKEASPELLEGRNPIEGIIFDIYFVATKDDLEHGYVPWSQKPTEEEIGWYKTPERIVATLRTDVNGIAEFSLTKFEQEPGLYLVVERKASIIKEPVDPFYVLLPMYDPTDLPNLINTVHVYPKNDIIEIEEPDGVINILKTDNTPEKLPLAGAKFKLGRIPKDEETPNGKVTVNGKIIDVVWVEFYTNKENSGEMVTEVTTDAEGKAVMSGLLYGTYYIKEIEAPEGYLKLTDAKVVQVSKYSTSREVSVTFENILGQPLLPATGGIGTKIFISVGVLLTVISMTLIIFKSRIKNYGNNNEEKILSADEYDW